MSEPQPEVDPSVPGGSDPASAPTSGAGPRVAAPNRRTSLVPLLVFAIVGFVLAAVATGVYFYDRATQPDRSTPTVTVDRFLKATLVDHSGTAADAFVCDDWTGDEALGAMEAAVDPDVVRVTWDAPAIVRDDTETAQVQVRLRFRYPDDVSPSGERYWVFDLAEQKGWRVCGARALLQPN